MWSQGQAAQWLTETVHVAVEAVCKRGTKLSHTKDRSQVYVCVCVCVMILTDGRVPLSGGRHMLL